MTPDLAYQLRVQSADTTESRRGDFVGEWDTLAEARAAFAERGTPNGYYDHYYILETATGRRLRAAIGGAA